MCCFREVSIVSKMDARSTEWRGGLFPSLSPLSGIWAVWIESYRHEQKCKFLQGTMKTVIPAWELLLKTKQALLFCIFLLHFRAPDVVHGFFQVYCEAAGGIHWMWQSPQMLGGRRPILVRHNKVQSTSVREAAAPSGSLVYKPWVYWRTSDFMEDCMSDMGGCYQEPESYYHCISPSLLEA